MEIVMKEIRTVEIEEFVGQQVRLQGWLHNLRLMGGISFIVLRDGWGTVQAVMEKEVDLAPLSELSLGTVIGLMGTAVATP